MLLAPDDGSSEGESWLTTIVLAVGSVPNYLGMESLENEAFDFKTLSDAIRIRNHVIDAFERADREPDPEVRRPLLTFVVAGGGFAGRGAGRRTERFLARHAGSLLPNVPEEEVRVSSAPQGIVSCRS